MRRNLYEREQKFASKIRATVGNYQLSRAILKNPNSSYIVRWKILGELLTVMALRIGFVFSVLGFLVPTVAATLKRIEGFSQCQIAQFAAALPDLQKSICTNWYMPFNVVTLELSSVMMSHLMTVSFFGVSDVFQYERRGLWISTLPRYYFDICGQSVVCAWREFELTKKSTEWNVFLEVSNSRRRRTWSTHGRSAVWLNII